MTYIISIDTSTEICSVALHHSSELLAEANLFLSKSHSQSLSLLIEQVLQHADLTYQDLSALAVSSGPGSYTGLRIGLSTVKGLAYALNIPIIGISSLDSMAMYVRALRLKENSEEEDTLLIPMLDARRMEVFCKVFDGELNEVRPLTALILEESSFDAFSDYKNIYLFGNGSNKAMQMYQEHANILFVNNVEPLSKHMGRLAFDKYLKKQFEDIAYFEPDYGKEFYTPQSKKKSFLQR